MRSYLFLGYELLAFAGFWKSRTNHDTARVESHCAGFIPGAPVFIAGITLGGDHPAVLANPQYLAPADTTTDEVAALRNALYATEPPEQPEVARPEPAKVLKPEDAFVPGKWIRKSEPAVKSKAARHPLTFVVPPVTLA
jgi:hypothetical protein